MATITEPTATPADPLAAAFAHWRQTVDAELQGVPFEKKLVTRTPEGIALQPLYTRADLALVSHLGARPGEAPFVRGKHPLGYRTQAWEICQEIGTCRAHDFNTALRGDLMQGQNSVGLTPDAATRAGTDPDEAASGSVGAGGVSLADGEDLAAALEGVALDAVPVHIPAGSDALPLAALYLALAHERGVSWETLTGSLSADPLGEWLESGRLPVALDALYDNLAGWTRWAAAHAPRLRTVGVNAILWNDAGASATQELAFALAGAVEYLRALGERGVPAAMVAERVRFQFASGPQFFVEVAKYRAFRLLWTRVLAAFGAPPEAAARAAIHARTSRWNKTVLDPHVNLLRVTTEAVSAVLGGVDSLHIAPFDEVAGESDEFSRRIARNVHTLLAEEFHFTATADPAGGSWYVERITDDLARKAWALFQEVEKRGGLAASLKDGYVQKLVAATAAEKNDAVARRRTALVGTNLFPNLREKPPVFRRCDLGALQAQRSRAIRARRGAAAAPVESVPREWPARLAAAVAAARDGATIGQLSRLAHDTARQEIVIEPLPVRRAASGFEMLRAAAEAFAQRTGARPKVFVAKMGPARQHKARADFTAGFFAVGGFELIAKQAFESAESAAEAAIASGAAVAVLCSTDETYPTLVPAFARAIKAADADIAVVLAGLPADTAVIASYRDAGIDEFIHIRASVHDVLAKFLKQIGALK